MLRKSEKHLECHRWIVATFICIFVSMMFTVSANAATSNNWCWPTYIHSVKNDWPNYSGGSYHGGTDFPVPLNTPIYSTCDGEVVSVRSLTTSYGKHIKIKATVNGGTVYIRYCHLNSFAVSSGDKVKAGDLIGYSGSTGNSTGPHLHYEIRNSSDYYGSSAAVLNPKNYLPGSSYTYTMHESSEKPVICVDYVKGGSGTVSLGGWGYWPGNNGKTVVLHVYTKINGSMKFLGEINCNTSRPDVNRVYGCGNNHGFSASFSSEIGSLPIYVYAITPDGKNPLMHTSTVTIYPTVTARAHVAERGWLNTVALDTASGKIKIGTEGQALDLEGFWAQIMYNGKSCLEGKLHIENIGWTSYADCSSTVGTTGRALHIESANFRLKNEVQNKFELYYRCHLRDKGWTSFVKATSDCGTTGENRAVECIELWLVPKK